MFLDDKPQGEVTEAPARPLKLSEAIRIGAAKRPQCTGYWYRDGRSCALGAAYEAWRGHIDDRNISAPGEAAAMIAAFPALLEVQDSIGRRNDRGDTREEIADWLEAQGL